MNNVTKAEILQVGTIGEDDEPVGWLFDCGNGANGLTIREDDSVLYGGYTIDELRIIRNKATAQP